MRTGTVSGAEATSQPVVTQLPPRLSLTGMTEHCPSVAASDGVGPTVASGEIHVVLSGNGTDKSALMRMIFNAVQPDTGEMLLDDQRVEIASPH